MSARGQSPSLAGQGLEPVDLPWVHGGLSGGLLDGPLKARLLEDKSAFPNTPDHCNTVQQFVCIVVGELCGAVRMLEGGGGLASPLDSPRLASLPAPGGWTSLERR